MDKAQVAEAESFLQKLLDENRLTLPQVQELFKKLQKASTNANSKKIADFKKDLSDFIQDKPEIKEYLEKSESNQSILIKAAQKISSKSQPKPTQENAQNSNQTKTKKSAYKVEKKNLIQIFNKEVEKNVNPDNLYVYFEMFSNNKIDEKEVPFFTMIFLPKEKKITVYLKTKEKMNLSFAQVDYLSNENQLFLDIDYFSMLENCELDKSREYKENCINLAQFEQYIKGIPLLKDNDTKITVVDNNYEKLKKEFKEYCESVKEKIKSVVTNNKDFFIEIAS
jgi:hypothetical protein